MRVWNGAGKQPDPSGLFSRCVPAAGVARGCGVERGSFAQPPARCGHPLPRLLGARGLGARDPGGVRTYIWILPVLALVASLAKRHSDVTLKEYAAFLFAAVCLLIKHFRDRKTVSFS